MSSTTPFPHLFNPIQVGSKTLEHRLNFGAHTANMSAEGLPAERHLGYYLERAIGGAAMIVVEPVPIHRTAVLTRGNFRHGDDGVIPHFRRITDACHEHGTVMIQQLYHVGAHGDFDLSYQPNWSPSGLPSMHDQDGSHAMTDPEIEELIEGFAQAARRAKEAGFDGCEIMAAYNALFEQFWSPFTNRRDDAWGGSFERRMQFSLQTLSRIRERCGNDFIIGVCVSVDPTRPDVLSIEDQQEVAAWHDERGLYDYVTVGTGSYFEFTRLMPTFVYEDKLGPPYAERIKQAVRHAKVQSESHIRTPENADDVIGSGQADMVSIVRGQIADPHMANKARAGRAEDVRPCLSCNQMCWGRRSRDYWISCLVNPSAGPRVRMGRRPVRPDRCPAQDSGRRRRTGRTRSGTSGGGARPPRHPGRGVRQAWAASSGSPGCSRAARRFSISSTGTSVSSRSCRSSCASTLRWSRMPSRNSTPTSWSSRPVPCPRRMDGSGGCLPWIGFRASTAGASSPSRTS